MVCKYYLQQVGLVSSGQRKTFELSVRMSGCIFLDFRRSSDSAVRESEGLLSREEDDVLKQIQAFFSTKGIPAGSSPDSQPPTAENAILVKSHLKR
jgi:hypothetical protein